MSYHSNILTILEYVNEYNNSTFNLWFSNLNDDVAEKITIAIYKVSLGNMNSCKSLGKGLWEIKLTFGAGLRVYFGKRGSRIILLWGGTKNKQSDDINRARLYWSEYIKSEEYIEWH